MCFTAKCLRCPFRSRARNNTDAKSGTYIIIPEIMAVCQGIFTKKIKLGGFIPTVTRWDLSVCPGFRVQEDFQIIIACIKRVMSRKGQISLRGQKYLER